jgi:predicted DNA-binding transcriptional regulator YafY
VRTFRVSRVQAVRVLDEPVARPEGFDLAVEWAAASESFVDSWPRLEVRARVRQSALWAIRHALDPAGAQRAIDGASAPDEHGWVDVTLGYESVEMAVHELLRFGPDLEVLDPPEARSLMAATAEAMVGRYAPVTA